MKEVLQKLFEHKTWSNRLVLNALERCDPPYGEALNLLAHILVSEGCWKRRLDKKDAEDSDVFPTTSLFECKNYIDVYEDIWRNYIDQIDANKMQETIHYIDRQNNQCTYTTLEVLFHICMHGQYHRAQINQALIREYSLKPLVFDFPCYLDRINS